MAKYSLYIDSELGPIRFCEENGMTWTLEDDEWVLIKESTPIV